MDLCIFTIFNFKLSQPFVFLISIYDDMNVIQSDNCPHETCTFISIVQIRSELGVKFHMIISMTGRPHKCSVKCGIKVYHISNFGDLETNKIAKDRTLKFEKL